MQRIIIGGLLVVASGVTTAQSSASSWPFYGHDAGGGRYTPLEQINEHTVSGLKVAWTYQTGELETYAGTSLMEKAAFETTPILLGRTLYLSTPSSRVIALDATSGRAKWVFDPKIDLRGDFSEFASRGVAAWPAGGVPGGPGHGSGEAKLIFVGTIDGHLIALDAGTGQAVPSFGD